MTPEERQLLTTLAERVKSTPAQQHDLEADQLLRQIVQERPDTVYILAQTVLMQDFALRNAQAQIDDLKRQASEAQGQQKGTGSFLGGLFGGGSREPQPQLSGSVPRVNPWSGGPQSQGRTYDAPPPPPPPLANYAGSYGGPVMQPSQTGGFLRGAAQTAAGVAGGALLFEGINSLFSGHSGGLLGSGGLGGGGLAGVTPRDSLSEKTVVNNYYGDDQGKGAEDRDAGSTQAAYDDHSGSGDDGLTDADYDSGYDDGGDDGGDFA